MNTPNTDKPFKLTEPFFHTIFDEDDWIEKKEARCKIDIQEFEEWHKKHGCKRIDPSFYYHAWQSSRDQMRKNYSEMKGVLK